MTNLHQITDVKVLCAALIEERRQDADESDSLDHGYDKQDRVFNLKEADRLYDHLESICPRQSVRRFASFMEEKLRHHDGKGGWEDLSCHEIWLRLKDELHVELAEALDQEANPAEVANFLMMLVEQYSGDYYQSAILRQGQEQQRGNNARNG